MGCSLITAVGQYVGGSLLIYNNDDMKTKPETWNIKDFSDVTEHNIKHKAVFFCGKKLHRTTPFEGHRTSIIFFASKWKDKMRSDGGRGHGGKSTEDELRNMGFRPHKKSIEGGRKK